MVADRRAFDGRAGQPFLDDETRQRPALPSDADSLPPAPRDTKTLDVLADGIGVET
jgi:hypothetical protein